MILWIILGETMSKLVTPRKAIKTLESEKRLIKVSIDGEEIVNSYDLAISALEYRIPKSLNIFIKSIRNINGKRKMMIRLIHSLGVMDIVTDPNVRDVMRCLANIAILTMIAKNVL